MNFKQFINERYGEFNTNDVIVVDIQPQYAKYIPFSVYTFADFIRQMLEKGRKILYFYNGTDTVGEDTKESIVDWLIDALLEGYPYNYEGEDEDYEQWEEDKYEKIQQLHNTFVRNIIWHDKGFGYLRTWMDEGVSAAGIIKAIRYMANKHISDSRDLKDGELEKILDEDLPNDSIFLPPIPLNILKNFNGAFICGGGKHECLKEVQLLMNAFNIKYTIFSQFVF